MTPPPSSETEDAAGSAPTADETEREFNEVATVGTLVDKPHLARVYIYICHYGPVTRPQIQDALDMAKTTVYDYIDRLADLGLVQIEGPRPQEVTAEPVCVRVDEITITPTLLHAVALQEIDKDVANFVEKYGVGKLAAAVRQAGLHHAGKITQRMAADPLDIHTGEAILIVHAVRPALAAGREFDPHFDINFPDVADEIEFEEVIDVTAPAPPTDDG